MLSLSRGYLLRWNQQQREICLNWTLKFHQQLERWTLRVVAFLIWWSKPARLRGDNRCSMNRKLQNWKHRFIPLELNMKQRCLKWNKKKREFNTCWEKYRIWKKDVVRQNVKLARWFACRKKWSCCRMLCVTLHMLWFKMLRSGTLNNLVQLHTCTWHLLVHCLSDHQKELCAHLLLQLLLKAPSLLSKLHYTNTSYKFMSCRWSFSPARNSWYFSRNSVKMLRMVNKPLKRKWRNWQCSWIPAVPTAHSWCRRRICCRNLLILFGVKKMLWTRTEWKWMQLLKLWMLIMINFKKEMQNCRRSVTVWKMKKCFCRMNLTEWLKMQRSGK